MSNVPVPEPEELGALAVLFVLIFPRIRPNRARTFSRKTKSIHASITHEKSAHSISLPHLSPCGWGGGVPILLPQEDHHRSVLVLVSHLP